MLDTEKIERKAKSNGMGNAFPDEMSCGLTKREWFAGMALQGLLACDIVRGTHENRSKFAVDHADALLKQLAESDGAK
jgi:hypothetical protein